MGIPAQAGNRPAGARLSVPAGSFWLQRTISLDEAAAEAALDLEELGSPNWDIFDGEWRYLGEVELPERFRLIRIAESGLYGVLSDENDVQFAVKLRLTRPGGHAGGAETS